MGEKDVILNVTDVTKVCLVLSVLHLFFSVWLQEVEGQRDREAHRRPIRYY